MDDKLYEAALKAYHNAYTPYSKFNVGTALLLADGKIVSGSNIENASYGLSNCAERSALFAAYSQGYRKQDIKRMLVIGSTDRPISPCGACRQVMNELIDPEVSRAHEFAWRQKIMKVRNSSPCLLGRRFGWESLNPVCCHCRSAECRQIYLDERGSRRKDFDHQPETPDHAQPDSGHLRAQANRSFSSTLPASTNPAASVNS